MNIEERVNEWRKGKASLDIKSECPYVYNAFRSFRYTEKGKKIGWSEEWTKFENFYNDMRDSYIDGYRLIRVDKSKPFSKDNCKWVSDDELALYKEQTLLIEYNGQKLSIKEWAIIADTTEAAIRNRYYKHPEYSAEEWIYGKRKARGSKIPKNATKDNIRTKASKMISAYKNKDKKNGTDICDITIEWMIDNIINQPCIYCGDTNRVGCDRIDNDRGHTMDNVVPCCYECNCARNNNFSFDEMKIIGKSIAQIKQNRMSEQSIN